MEYVVDVKDRVRGKISNRCRLQIITEVYYSLDAKHKEQFKESCFGHLMDVAEIKMSLQMVHQIILRAVRTTKEKEVWFRFGNRLARFGLEEFVLVTGLKAGELEYEDDSLGLKSDLMQRTFKKSKGKVTRKQLLSAFQRCTHQPDKLKLGLILIVAYVLLATEENTTLNLWWFYLVDDMDRFNNYAWGKRSYECTIGIFKRDFGETVKKYERNERYPYSLHGFPLAIMIWAFEAIPALGQEFAHRLEGHRIPRMSGWDFQHPKVDGETVSRFLETEIEMRSFRVKRTLVASSEEIDEEFYQGMTPFDDVEDSKVDNSFSEDGGEEPKKDEPDVSKPQQSYDRPSSSHNNDGLEVIRQEMREMERRIGTKLDRILQFIESGGFRSDRGAFQSEMRGFDTYSPHHEGSVPEEKGKPEEENKEQEEAHVVQDAVKNSIVAEDCTYEEEQVTPIQREGPRNATGEGMVTNPSTAITLYRGMPHILIPDSEHRLGQREPVDIVMSNQLEQPVETSHGDQVGESSAILLEDQTDEESPKGRGQRKRRKGKSLRTPWTNPLKRRKFKNVTVFDPFREVDHAKASDLNEWLEKASPRDAVALAICDVGRKFFDDLRDESGWLNGDHVDSALFHIRERAVKYADLFRHDCAVLDSNFWQFVESAYKNMEKSGQNKSEFEFAKVLVNYAEGATPSLGKPWLNCRYLYIPYCVPQVHWFALEVDLEERRINIFDSLTSRVREANLVKFMKPLKVVLPWLLKKHVDGNYNTSMFTHHKVKKLPVQENGSDCGVFTVKFIEFSVAGLDLNLVQPKHMLMWRQKMAAEIFGGEFDP